MQQTWRHRAFGLELTSDFRVPNLPAADGATGSLPTRLSRLSPLPGPGSWRYPRGEILIDRRHADGRLMIGIDRPERSSYRVWAPGHGRYLISEDGLRIQAAVGRGPAWSWQRLLFAQVLPLAAALRGFTVFHASAVALADRAFAFIASSGTGKTSAALSLVARGASLVTDDVLAVSVAEGEIIAHPGAGVVSVFADDLAALNHAGSARLGHVLGGEDKLHVGTPLIDRALPLSGVYVLERRAEIRQLEIIRTVPASPDLLLGSAFISYVRSPGYLISHLDACSRIAQEVPVFRVHVPLAAGSGQLADALETHLGALGSAAGS